MAARYLNVDKLKRFIRSQSTDDEGLYAEACLAAEQFLDNECQRSFTLAGTSATSRSYRPDSYGAPTLFIHDCTQITAVVENGTTLTANVDYVAEPLNGLSPAGETRPYDRLTRYATQWYSNFNLPTVTVTAKWGWAEYPPGIEFAGLVCAKAYLEARDIRAGLAQFGDVGVAGEREAKAVRDFIREYRGHSSWGIA